MVTFAKLEDGAVDASIPDQQGQRGKDGRDECLAVWYTYINEGKTSKVDSKPAAHLRRCGTTNFASPGPGQCLGQPAARSLQHPLRKMENYERGEKLGEGAWGVVTSAVS